MEFRIFDTYRDLVKSVLKKGDVGWIVGIERGSRIVIDESRYFIEGRISKTHEKEKSTQSLVCYEGTETRSRKTKEMYFLSDEMVLIEGKIKRWYWYDSPLPLILPELVPPPEKRQKFVFDEEEEEEPKPRKEDKSKKKHDDTFLAPPYCGYTEITQNEKWNPEAEEVSTTNAKEEARIVGSISNVGIDRPFAEEMWCFKCVSYLERSEFSKSQQRNPLWMQRVCKVHEKSD